jgi:hypothetical protein
MILVPITLKCDICGATTPAQIEGWPSPDRVIVQAPPGWSETHTRRRDVITLGAPCAICPACQARNRASNRQTGDTP